MIGMLQMSWFVQIFLKTSTWYYALLRSYLDF